MTSTFSRDRGFEDKRFELPVSENFKCSICLNVLNNPKSCRNNQHYFCYGCIFEHLKNSHTCPECLEELTPETLVQPPRVWLNCILELRIKCDHSQRGCPEYVQLGRLQNHVDECGFAPARCENEGCGAEVNRGEKARHEGELCKFRKFECYGCAELKKEIQELRKTQENANKKIEGKQVDMDRKMAEMWEHQVRIKAGFKEAFKESLIKIESIFKDDSRSDCLATQNPHALKTLVTQSAQEIGCFRINNDIFVVGGLDKDGKPINSVEKFCFEEGRWIDVAPMVVPRASASSVVLSNPVIVSGGKTTQKNPSNSIELLHLDQLPLKWRMFAGKLPASFSRHRTFFYYGKFIVVGTYNKIEKDKRGREISTGSFHAIYEVLLAPPYTATPLYSLSELSDRFTAELVNNKLFTFGCYNAYRDVITYNLDTNECREMPHLPYSYPLLGMTNVQWRNCVILLGGKPAYNKATRKFEMIKYNTITGESKMLAPANDERVDCTAVITDDVIVAMGGRENVNSVECYNFQTNTWQVLPVMRERRYLATAVVSPI